MNRQSAAAVIDAARFNRTHWLILGWGCFIMLFDGYDMVIYGSVVPRLMQEWQLSPVQAGTLGSCALFGMLFGGTLLVDPEDASFTYRITTDGGIGELVSGDPRSGEIPLIPFNPGFDTLPPDDRPDGCEGCVPSEVEDCGVIVD